MIIEQVRYFVTSDEAAERAAEVRREVDFVRRGLGLPPGHLLIADPPPDDGPAVVWQCGYESEHMLAVAEAAIAGSAEYASVRDRLSEIASKIELELYTADENEQAD